MASGSPAAEEWRDASTSARGGTLATGVPGSQRLTQGRLLSPPGMTSLPRFQLSSTGVLVNNQISSYDELPLCFFSAFPLVGSLFIPHFWWGQFSEQRVSVQGGC